MCWICTCSLPCPNDIVHTCKCSRTASYLSNGSGRQSKAYGLTQCRQRLPGNASRYPYPSPTLLYLSTKTNLEFASHPFFARSFVLAFRIMKLIITEQGNNAWLAHGTPHLNVRSDFVDTQTGIKPKQTFEACNM